jgi:hypothetical protein
MIFAVTFVPKRERCVHCNSYLDRVQACETAAISTAIYFIFFGKRDLRTSGPLFVDFHAAFRNGLERLRTALVVAPRKDRLHGGTETSGLFFYRDIDFCACCVRQQLTPTG